MTALSRCTSLASVILALSGSVFSACSDDPAPTTSAVAEGAGPLLFVTTDTAQEAVADALAYAPGTSAPVISADPEAALGPARDEQIRVAVVKDERCADCYRIDGTAGRYVIRGGGPTGLSYGITALLENLGYAFYSPYEASAPATLLRPETAPGFGVDHSPSQTLRGVQLHTLHPIEAYFDFWERSPESLERAKRDIDWIVRQRGNFVQWVALGDPQADDATEAAYREHTKAITDYAHRRGVKVGVAVQLFAKGSLQNNWVLIRSPTDDDAQERIAEETKRLVTGTGIDLISLNFGEFIGITPEAFIEGTNAAVATIRESAPGVEIAGTIHVGEHNRVDYDGKSVIYYFLLDACDPTVKRWVHTVMYYDLDGDAGGAYDHETFHDHRDLLQSKIAKNEEVAYFPESAYWIAFDNSVPTFLPVYVEQRRRDMALLPGLKEHVLFTSGWEWGYWQTDAATLRMGYELPATTQAAYEDLFRPLGADGVAVASLLTQVADEQRKALIDQRLAAYVAGRDAYIDLGDTQDIHSQPDRIVARELVALAASDPTAFTAFETTTLAPLEAFATKLEGFADAAKGYANSDQKALREVADGLAVTALRVRYSSQIYRIALALGRAEPTETLFAEAQATLDAAKVVVAKRHGDLWHPDATKLTTSSKNLTIYPFGYLTQANTLCFWARELVEVTNLRDGTNKTMPGCVN
jgi:hypothetical protein